MPSRTGGQDRAHPYLFPKTERCGHLLVVAACGIVYGDIGASVLYTLREIFFGPHTSGQVPLTPDNVMGAVSLIFWSYNEIWHVFSVL